MSVSTRGYTGHCTEFRLPLDHRALVWETPENLALVIEKLVSELNGANETIDELALELRVISEENAGVRLTKKMKERIKETVAKQKRRGLRVALLNQK